VTQSTLHPTLHPAAQRDTRISRKKMGPTGFIIFLSFTDGAARCGILLLDCPRLASRSGLDLRTCVWRTGCLALVSLGALDIREGVGSRSNSELCVVDLSRLCQQLRYSSWYAFLVLGARLASLHACCAVSVDQASVADRAVALDALVADLPARIFDVALSVCELEVSNVWAYTQAYLDRVSLRHGRMTARAAPLGLVINDTAALVTVGLLVDEMALEKVSIAST
jgi:hypothetical protein